MALETSYPIISAIKKIINSFGRSILDERQRFLALLKDYYPYDDLSFYLVSLSHKHRFDQVLSQRNLPYQSQIKILSSLLTTKYGTDPDNAQLAVWIWAECLEISSSDQQEKNAETKPKSSENHDNQKPDASSISNLLFRKNKVYLDNCELILSLNGDDITGSPDALFWYDYQAYATLGYLLGDDIQFIDTSVRKKLLPRKFDKPILLVGHEKFGGSFLVQWAIREAETILEESCLKKKNPFLVIYVDLLGREDNVLQISLENFFWINHQNQILSKALSKDLKRAYEDVLSGFPVKEIKEFKHIRMRGIGPVTLEMFGVTITIGGKNTDGDEAVYSPKKQLEQLIDCLRMLALDLPIKLKDKSIKIILVVDQLDRWDHLKSLEPLLITKGALRTIIVLEKPTFDQCFSKEFHRWIERNLDVVYCPQLWDRDIAPQILSNYFSTYRNIKRKVLNQVLEGLNFLLAGSPGNYKKIVTEHEWDKYCSGSKLKLPAALVQKYVEAAKYYQVLKESSLWFARSIDFDYHDNLEKRQDRVQLYIHSILKNIYEREKLEWSTEDIRGVVEESRSSAGFLLDESDYQLITGFLLDQLQKYSVFIGQNAQ